MNRRFVKLPFWLAGVYLAWGLLVFFGSLGSESHAWWPIFLHPVIWPLSALYETLNSVCLNWLVPNPKSTPSWIWTVNDYLSGAFYIIAGTIWIWCLGRLLSIVATRIFPIRERK